MWIYLLLKTVCNICSIFSSLSHVCLKPEWSTALGNYWAFIKFNLWAGRSRCHSLLYRILCCQTGLVGLGSAPAVFPGKLLSLALLPACQTPVPVPIQELLPASIPCLLTLPAYHATRQLWLGAGSGCSGDMLSPHLFELQIWQLTRSYILYF